MLGMLSFLQASEPAKQDSWAEPHRVAAIIDEEIAKAWDAAGVVPAGPADDAEFLRRISLDLIGRIPNVMSARDYLEQDDPGKCEALIDSLLSDSRFIVHFTNMWSNALLPPSDGNLNNQIYVPSFEVWLRQSLLTEVSYRDLVLQILDSSAAQGGAYQSVNDSSPAAFFATRENKPENLAAATSRLFLGVRIECAQCHDHPFDSWTQKDFWGFAAFFANESARRDARPSFLSSMRSVFGVSNGIRIPDTNEFVRPTFLDGTSLEGSASAKRALATWITDKDNPYFSRMAVNRIWAHFFGIGLVDPVDDFSDLNPPSHPELLDLLAREFREHDYDMKFLIRAIVSSKTYQLSSVQTHESQSYPQRFGKQALKGLTADQVVANLTEATGGFKSFTTNPPIFSIGPEARIRELFQNSDGNAVDQPTTILQSLSLMNGELVVSATDVQNSRTLAAVLDFPGFDREQQLETLFLAALTRFPTEEERERFLTYIDQRETDESSTQALADIFWVLLNSSEFLYNH